MPLLHRRCRPTRSRSELGGTRQPGVRGVDFLAAKNKSGDGRVGGDFVGLARGARK